MKLTVKLFATFRDGREKVQILTLPENATPVNILNILRIAVEDVAILLINGRDGEFSRALADNDVISIFPPVGGG